jgi:hypothetical protein
LLSKKPKRIIEWISKAWTTYEMKSLPIFYKETIARILALEHFRNLIETQAPGHGMNHLLLGSSPRDKAHLFEQQREAFHLEAARDFRSH